jgi:hypothetical protein
MQERGICVSGRGEWTGWCFDMTLRPCNRSFRLVLTHSLTMTQAAASSSSPSASATVSRQAPIINEHITEGQ